MMAKHGYPLSAEDSLLLMAVKGIPGLVQLDTDPTVRLPLPVPMEAKDFTDWVVDTSGNAADLTDPEVEAQLMSDKQGQQYHEVVMACARDQGNIFSILSNSKFRTNLRFLFEAAGNENTEKWKEMVKKSATFNMPGPCEVHCECPECANQPADQPEGANQPGPPARHSPPLHPALGAFYRPWM